MAFDPNLYAIEMELNLNAEPTFDSLSKLEYTVTNIEESLVAAMTETTNLVTQQAQNLNIQLSSMVDTLDVQSEAAVQDYELFSAYNDLMLENGEERDRQKEIEDELSELHIEEFDIYEQLIEAHELMLKNYIKEKVQLNDIVNVLARDLALRKEAVSVVDGMDGPLEDMAQTTEDAFNKTRNLTAQLKKLSEGMRAVRVETERRNAAAKEFIDVNYRAYESQTQLLLSTQMLAAEQGVMYDAALDSMKALMGLRVAEKDLESLVVTTARASKITGVNVQSLAQYERKLITTGHSLEQIEDKIETVIAAQREFGLTADDVTTILNKQTSSAIHLSNVFGEDFAEDNLKLSLSFSAMAKNAGAAGDAFDEVMSHVTSTGTEALSIFQRFERTDLINASQEERALGILNQVKKLNSQLTRNKELNGGQANAAFMAHYNTQIDILKMTQEKFHQVAASVEALGIEGPINLENMTKALESKRTVAEESAIAMQTLSDQFSDFSEAVESIRAPLYAFVAEGMMPIIQTATWMVTSFVSVITTLRDFYATVERLFPPLKLFTSAIKVIAGSFILIVGLGGGAIAVLTAFAAAMYTVYGATRTLFSLFSGRFLPAIRTATAGFETIMISMVNVVSTGIVTLGNAARSVMVPLLALSASIFLIGSAAFLFASGVAMIADRGLVAVAATAGLAITIGVLGLALIGLATLALPILPALVSVGLAMVTVGAAAVLMGAGVSLASIGIEQIAKYGINAAIAIGYLTAAFGAFSVVGFLVGPMIVSLALSVSTAMISIGTAAVVAAPGLLALSGIAVVLAGAFYIAGAGMDLFVEGMIKLSDIEVSSFGGALFLMAIEVSAAGLILGVAASGLILAGFGLEKFTIGFKEISKVEFKGFSGKLYGFAAEVGFAGLLLGIALSPLILAGISLRAFAFGLKAMAGLEIKGFENKLYGFAAEVGFAGLLLGIALSPLILAGLGLRGFAFGLKAMSGIEINGFANKLYGFAAEVATAGLLLGIVSIPLILAGAGLWMFGVGLRELSDIEINGFANKLYGFAAEVATAGLLLGIVSIPLIASGAGLWMFAVGLQKLSGIEINGFGDKLYGFAAEVATAGLLLGIVSIPLIASGVGLWSFAFGLQKLSGIEIGGFGDKLYDLATRSAVGAIALGVVLTPLIVAGAGLWSFASGLRKTANLKLPDFGGKLLGFAAQITLGSVALGIVLAPLVLAGIGLRFFLDGLRKTANLKIPSFGGKLFSFSVNVAFGAAALGLAIIPLITAGTGLHSFTVGLQKISNIKIDGFGGKLKELAFEVAVGAAALGLAIIPLIASGVGLWSFAFGLQKMAKIKIDGFGGHLTEFAESLFDASLILGPAVVGLNVGLALLITTSGLFATAGTALLVGGTLFAIGVTSAVRGIKSLDGASEILEKFGDSLSRLENASLSGLREVVSDLGFVTGNIDHYISRITTAGEKLNTVEFDGSKLIDSLTAFSTQLNVVIDKLDKPAELLADKVERIVDSVKNLIDADAKVQEIGQNLAVAVSEEKTGHQVSEFRAVEKVTEVIDNVVSKPDNETEDTELLRQIAALMEQLVNKDVKHEPVEDNVSRLSLTAESVTDAGVNI